MSPQKNALPHVSVTGRIVSHRDKIVGAWRTDSPANSPPSCVEIHLTDNCNADCPFCFYGSGKLTVTRKLDEKVAMKLCHELCEMKVKAVILSGGGEPTLHPSFPRIVETLLAAGVEVGVITNGLCNKEPVLNALSLCTWIKYSVHTHLSHNYPNVMGVGAAAFKIVSNNIVRAIQDCSKERTRIGVGCVITKWTDSDEHIFGFFDHFSNLGVNYVLYKDCIGYPQEFRSIREKAAFENLMPELKRRAKATGTYTNFHTFVRDYAAKREVFCGKCPIVWDGLIAMVSATGDVFGCLPIMQQGIPTNSYGNCNVMSFMGIWEGKKRQAWLASQNDAHCPPCRYERMFSTMNRLVDGAISESAASLDQHWKFI